MAQERREDRGKRQERNPLREWATTLGLALVLFLIIRTFFLQSFYISSGSMEETLLVGDVLMVSKAAYGAKIPGTAARLPGYASPSRGEIAIFRPPHEPETDVVKRLVGVPGDTLSMRDRQLYLNGEAYPEPYVRHEPDEPDESHPWMRWQYDALAPGVDPEEYSPTRDNWGPVVVPEGRFFALGDNRERSLDSRYYGFVDQRQVRGRVSFLYYSFDPTAGRSLPLLTAVRWERIASRPWR